MSARIYQPSRNAMQSGLAQTKYWVLEYEPQSRRRIDPLMGWTGSRDMDSQIQLKFDSKEDAVAYARRNGIAFRVIEPKRRGPSPKSYGDNFKFGRIGTWTH